MISIDKKSGEYVLDLNEMPYDEHTIKVSSVNSNGENIPWGIEMMTNDFISAEPGADNTLNVYVDVEHFTSDAFILLRNYEKERLKVIVKPNLMLSAPKTYKFRISKKSTDGRKTKIRILSKENNNEIGWKCTYDGRPLNYSIVPMESDKSGYVNIEVIDELFTEIDSIIEFTQDRSGEVTILKLNQTNDDTTIKTD